MPFLFFGFFIKSELDNNISIPKKYKPFYFKHYARINADIYRDQYYYGIKISNISPISKLMENLQKNTINNDIVTLSMYRNMLKPFNLTCDDCYKNYMIGSFPLDIIHLYKFVNLKGKKMIEDFYNIKSKVNLAGLHLNIITAHPKFEQPIIECTIL